MNETQTVQQSLLRRISKDFLLCLKCKAEYSASTADYETISNSQILRCCGRPLVLARNIVITQRVSNDPIRVGQLGGSKNEDA